MEPLPARANGNQNKVSQKRGIEYAYRRFRNTLSRTKLRVPLMWFYHRNFQPSDVFLACYPRSGSTWARFVLFEALTGQESTFDAVNRDLNGIKQHKLGRPILPQGGRLIGTHEPFRKEYRRAIYMVRDARDVVLSEHAFLKALDYYSGDLDSFAKSFVRGNVNGFGSWQDHVTSFLDSPLASTSDLLVVQYKELRRNPEIGYSRIVDFLGVKVDRERIRRAIANNSLDKMGPKVDGSARMPWRKDRVVRSGSVEGWRSKLSPSQLELIERHCGDVMLRLGYVLAKNSVEDSALQSASR